MTISDSRAEGAKPSLLYIDIETFSPTSLINYGVYRYTEDPEFKILLFAYAYDDDPVKIVDLDNGEKLPDQICHDLQDPSVHKIAFNASFERICLSRRLGIKYLDPEGWRCARAQSLYLGTGNASLKSVGFFLGIEAKKLESGKGLIEKFSLPLESRTIEADTLFGQSPNRMRAADLPEDWELFKTYCMRDVEAEREIWKRCQAINPMPEREWEIYALSERINDRGVGLDLDLVADVFEIQKQFMNEKLEALKKIDPDLNIKSNDQVIKWMADHGVSIETAGKEQMLEILDDPDESDEVKEVAKLRLEINKNALAKFQAFVDASNHDFRARGLFLYYGAHTGRWVSLKVNLQNMPRPTLSTDEIHRARELALKRDYEGFKKEFPAVSDALSSLIRTVIVGYPKLSVCDFSSVEARIAPYLTDEKWQLEAFANNEDIYCSTASMMYGVPVEKNGVNGGLRKLGKVAILGSNYGGGYRALKRMNPKMNDEELMTIVTKYRASVPNITGGWSQLEEAAKTAIRTKSTQAWKHGISFIYANKCLLCELPSGRRLCYPKATIKEGEITYHDIGRTGEREVSTYGGKLFENVVSGVARDCLCSAMLAIERAGLKIIGHVHDEVIVEGECLEQLEEIFARPIPYLYGLKLKGDGFVSEYYRKD